MNLQIKNIHEWSHRQRMFAVILFFIVIFFLGYRLLISGLTTRLAKAEQTENMAKQELKVLYTKQMMLRAELVQLPTLQSTLAWLQRKLIHQNELPEILNTILKIGADQRLNFVMFNPEEEQVVDKHIKIPIKVIVRGGYHQLGDFISHIANLPWIIVVDNFTISSLGSVGEAQVSGRVNHSPLLPSSTLNADFDFALYRAPQGDELAKRKEKEKAKNPNVNVAPAPVNLLPARTKVDEM